MIKILIVFALNIFSFAYAASDKCGPILEMNEGFKEVMREVLYLTDDKTIESVSIKNESFQKFVIESELTNKSDSFAKVVAKNVTKLDLEDGRVYVKVAKKIFNTESNFRNGIYLNSTHSTWDFKQKWRSFLASDKIINDLNVVYYKYCRKL